MSPEVSVIPFQPVTAAPVEGVYIRNQIPGISLIDDHQLRSAKVLDAFISLRLERRGPAVGGNGPHVAAGGPDNTLDRADHRDEIAFCQGVQQRLADMWR